MDKSTQKNIPESPVREHAEHVAAEILFFDGEKKVFPAMPDGEKNISPGGFFSNNVPNVPDVPVFDPSKALDAKKEVIQLAIAEIEKAIEICKDI
jgi:hypothetical protein